MLEAMLARHAAPTLAGLKTANLFAVRYASYHALAEQAAALHQRLCKKGVCVCLPAAPPAARFVRTGQPQHSPRLRLPQRFCAGLPVAAQAPPGAVRAVSARNRPVFGLSALRCAGFSARCRQAQQAQRILAGVWRCTGGVGVVCQIQKMCRCLCALPCKRNFYLAAHRSCLTYSLKESRVL